MPPIRVLQVMPAMDAGGMETFVMNVYRTIDREKVQFDFLYHYDKPCFFDDEIRALGGRIFKLTVRQDNNLPRYLRDLRTLFAAHPEWRIIHGHYSGFGMFYNPAARRAGIPVRCGHSHNTAYERNFVGRLDHFMSSFFNIGLTDRFACRLFDSYERVLSRLEEKMPEKATRSEERRVGKECRIGCRSRWSPYH